MIYPQSREEKYNCESSRAVKKTCAAFAEVNDSGNSENDDKKMGQGDEEEVEPEEKGRTHVSAL